MISTGRYVHHRDRQKCIDQHRFCSGSGQSISTTVIVDPSIDSVASISQSVRSVSLHPPTQTASSIASIGHLRRRQLRQPASTDTESSNGSGQRISTTVSSVLSVNSAARTSHRRDIRQLRRHFRQLRRCQPPSSVCRAASLPPPTRTAATAAARASPPPSQKASSIASIGHPRQSAELPACLHRHGLQRRQRPEHLYLRHLRTSH